MFNSKAIAINREFFNDNDYIFQIIGPTVNWKIINNSDLAITKWGSKILGYL